MGLVCIKEKAREARLRWFGHVQTGGGVTKGMSNEELEVKRRVGRPRKTWMDNIKADMQGKGLGVGDWSDKNVATYNPGSRPYWLKLLRRRRKSSEFSPFLSFTVSYSTFENLAASYLHRIPNHYNYHFPMKFP